MGAFASFELEIQRTIVLSVFHILVGLFLCWIFSFAFLKFLFTIKEKTETDGEMELEASSKISFV